MNFKKPTDIQFKAIPYILNGEDVMAVAQTGTGKTAAFVIPVIQRLLNNKSKGIRCVVLVPTRAVEFIAIDFIITNSGVSFE